MLLTAAMLAVGMVALGGRVEAAIAGATVALAQRCARRGSLGLGMDLGFHRVSLLQMEAADLREQLGLPAS